MRGILKKSPAFYTLVLAGVFAFAAPASGQTDPVSPLIQSVSGNPHTLTLGETAGFEILPDSTPTSTMLTDGSFEDGDTERQATLFIVSSDSESDGALPDDIELFAAVMMYMTEDFFKKIKIKDTRTLTLAGLPAAETLAKAKGVKTGEKLKLVQWMVFSTEGRFIRIIGYAPKDKFDEALPRFEQVRDGLVFGG